MIQGIGVDITTTMRIEKSMQKESFVKKVFSKQEQELLEKHKNKRKAELAAGCFAAKEAFLKAAGVGLGGFSLADIGVLRKDSGQPYYVLEGSAKKYCAEKGIAPMLSLSHEGDAVIAFCVFEG